MGTKKYFTNKEVPNVYVVKLDHLTVKNVMDKVYHVPEVRCYLPEFDEPAHKKMNRDFLFAIVNKIDASYFTRAQNDIEETFPKKAVENKVDSIEIRPELLEILKAARERQKHVPPISNTKALTSMLASTKKRARRQFEH